MTIPVQQFQILSPEQANPLGQGFSKAQDLYRQFIINKNLPEQLKQQSKATELANAIASAKAQYAPEQEQANLQKQQLTNKFMPLDNLIRAQQASQQGSRFGGAYQLARGLQAMSPAARQLWISQHQDEYNEMLSGLGSQTSNNFITPEIMQQYFGGNGTNNSQAQSTNFPYQGQQSTQQPQQSAPPQFSSMNPVRFSQSTPEQTKNTQLANETSANNELTTASTRRQYEGAIQVEGIMNSPEFQSQAQNAAAYAGAMGKGKAAIDALSQTNPKAYEDYLSFKNQTLVLLENRIKTLDQMGATNAQREELKGLYDKTADALTSNPEQFLIQLNNLGRVLNMVAQSVQKSASPLTKQNRIGNFNEIPTPQVNTQTIKGKTYYRIGNTNDWTDGK